MSNTKVSTRAILEASQELLQSPRSPSRKNNNASPRRLAASGVTSTHPPRPPPRGMPHQNSENLVGAPSDGEMPFYQILEENSRMHKMLPLLGRCLVIARSSRGRHERYVLTLATFCRRLVNHQRRHAWVKWVCETRTGIFLAKLRERTAVHAETRVKVAITVWRHTSAQFRRFRKARAFERLSRWADLSGASAVRVLTMALACTRLTLLKAISRWRRSARATATASQQVHMQQRYRHVALTAMNWSRLDARVTVEVAHQLSRAMATWRRGTDYEIGAHQATVRCRSIFSADRVLRRLDVRLQMRQLSARHRRFGIWARLNGLRKWAQRCIRRVEIDRTWSALYVWKLLLVAAKNHDLRVASIEANLLLPNSFIKLILKERKKLRVRRLVFNSWFFFARRRRLTMHSCLRSIIRRSMDRLTNYPIAIAWRRWLLVN